MVASSALHSSRVKVRLPSLDQQRGCPDGLPNMLYFVRLARSFPRGGRCRELGICSAGLG